MAMMSNIVYSMSSTENYKIKTIIYVRESKVLVEYYALIIFHILNQCLILILKVDKIYSNEMFELTEV